MTSCNFPIKYYIISIIKLRQHLFTQSKVSNVIIYEVNSNFTNTLKGLECLKMFSFEQLLKVSLKPFERYQHLEIMWIVLCVFSLCHITFL